MGSYFSGHPCERSNKQDADTKAKPCSYIMIVSTHTSPCKLPDRACALESPFRFTSTHAITPYSIGNGPSPVQLHHLFPNHFRILQYPRLCEGYQVNIYVLNLWRSRFLSVLNAMSAGFFSSILQSVAVVTERSFSGRSTDGSEAVLGDVLLGQ